MQLVADANVLLSAVIGGRAALVLRHEQVEQVFTPAAAYDEVFEYLGPLAKKKRLQLDTLLLTLAALPVTVVERSEYERHLPDAQRRIGKRDPDDVDVLALALHMNLEVWSNDNDFEDAGVEWHTTAKLRTVRADTYSSKSLGRVDNPPTVSGKGRGIRQPMDRNQRMFVFSVGIRDEHRHGRRLCVMAPSPCQEAHQRNV